MDVFTKEKRSEIMSRIRSKDTKVEKEFRKALSREIYPKGYRYRLNHRAVLGTPDIVFMKQKIAVFIDGDFWHGRDFAKRKNKLPKKYWRNKIQKNIERDKRVNRDIKKMGWRVIRLWEGDIKKDTLKQVEKVKNSLQK